MAKIRAGLASCYIENMDEHHISTDTNVTWTDEELETALDGVSAWEQAGRGFGTSTTRPRFGAPWLSAAIKLGEELKARNLELLLPIWRAEARADYAAKKMAEGSGPVRRYKYHEYTPATHKDAPDDRRRRHDKERRRESRNGAVDVARPYTDLSGMTDKEKAEHKRAQDKKRKADQRRRDGELPVMSPSGGAMIRLEGLHLPTSAVEE